MPTTQAVYNWINNHRLKIKPCHLLRSRTYWHKKARTSSLWRDISLFNLTPISFRPKVINERKTFGHYEIDLVVSAKGGKSTILTFVKRKTRKAFGIKTKNKTMKEINEKLQELILRNNLHIENITKDNGSEFNLLHKITNELNVPLYTCNPYASCEKESNENFNGLLRRKMPKGTIFDNVSDEKIDTIFTEINKMPQKILGYKSSHQSFEAYL